MSRSVWKGPHVSAALLRKIEKYKKSKESKQKLNTWSRGSVILPDFIGMHFNIYNGCRWVPVLITDEMIGHKFGEFALTRKVAKHKKKK